MRALVILFIIAAGVAADTAVLQPDGALGKDAYTYVVHPDTNYGDTDVIGCYGDLSGQQQITFIEFVELNDPVYQGANVTSAFLSFNVNSIVSGTQFYMCRVADPWDENSITWNNMPMVSYQIGVDYPVGTGWFNIDVTNLVQEWLDGTEPNHGFCFIEYGNYWLFWDSSDHTDPDLRPRLTMAYDPLALSGVTWGALKASLR